MKTKRNKIRDISRKELLSILKDKGYTYVRTKGDHDMYSNGLHLIPIPFVMNKWLSIRILKQCKINLREVF